MPTTSSSPKRAQRVGYAAGSADLWRLSTLWHVAGGSASAVIAAPNHLGCRGMNTSVRHREWHANAQTKAGPDTASARPPAVPPGLRQWNRGTGRDISQPMTWWRPVPCAHRSAMACLLRGAAIPPRCSLPGPCIPYLIAEERVRGVRPYGSWAQLRVPCQQRYGRRRWHL